MPGSSGTVIEHPNESSPAVTSDPFAQPGWAWQAIFAGALIVGIVQQTFAWNRKRNKIHDEKIREQVLAEGIAKKSHDEFEGVKAEIKTLAAGQLHLQNQIISSQEETKKQITEHREVVSTAIKQMTEAMSELNLKLGKFGTLPPDQHRRTYKPRVRKMP